MRGTPFDPSTSVAGFKPSEGVQSLKNERFTKTEWSVSSQSRPGAEKP
jgi:hypothetical protein